MNCFKNINVLLLFLGAFFLLSVTQAHEALLFDLQQSYQAELRWGDMVEPSLSLVIMLESKDFDENSVIKEASQYLREFTSHYEQVFFVFSDLPALKFIPAKRYGVLLTVQSDEEKKTITALTDSDIDNAVKHLRVSENLRASSMTNHLHSEE